MRLDHVLPAGFRILSVLEQASHVIDCALTLIDGARETFAVRIRDLTISEVKLLLSWLRHELGDVFMVICEAPALPNDSFLAPFVAAISPAAREIQVRVALRYGQTYPVGLAT